MYINNINMSEIWKVYKKTQRTAWEVSNYGNVKKNGELHECSINCSGYKMIAHICLHKAVAELFIPNPENKPEIDHIDTDKLNNHIDNLRWCTRKENNNNPLTKQKMSEAKKGKPRSEETKKNMKRIDNRPVYITTFTGDRIEWALKNVLDEFNINYMTLCNALRRKSIPIPMKRKGIIKVEYLNWTGENILEINV